MNEKNFGFMQLIHSKSVYKKIICKDFKTLKKLNNTYGF